MLCCRRRGQVRCRPWYLLVAEFLSFQVCCSIQLVVKSVNCCIFATLIGGIGLDCCRAGNGRQSVKR